MKKMTYVIYFNGLEDVSKKYSTGLLRTSANRHILNTSSNLSTKGFDLLDQQISQHIVTDI